MADFRLFDAEGRITLNDRDLDRGLRGAKRKVQRTMAEIRAMRAEAEIRADIKDVEKKAKAAQREIRALDNERATLKVGADKSEFDRKIAAAKAEADALDGRKIELKIELDQRNAAIREVSKQFREVRQEAGHTGGALGKLFGTLSTLTVRVGPFTASLKQLAVALTLLAPVIMGVVGALGALTASVASGALGAFAVGGAALAGFGLSALGVGLILKPLVGDLKDAFKAQEAYNTAVSKYGKNSDQAKNAAQKLNNVLKGTSKETREQFRDLGKLSSQWGKLTKSARPAFFNTLGEGIKTARALMPTFARESTATFKTAAAGVQSWLKGLRSPEAKNILGNVMSRFRAGLGPAMRGLGSFATGLARIGNSASRYLEPAGKAFERFAGRFATQGGVDAKVDRWVTSLKAVARFGRAAAGALTALGRAATGAGNDLLGSMSGALEKWTEWARTAEGQQSIREWFEGAVDTVKDLAAAIAPLIKAFITWSDAIRPVSDAMLKVVEGLGKLIGFLSQIPGFAPAVTALFAAFVASRIVAATRALAEFVGLMRVAAGLGGAGMLGGFLGGGRGGKGGRGRGGGGMFPIFGGGGSKGAGRWTGGPIVLDDGAMTKDADRAAGKWKGRLRGAITKGRVLTAGGAALTLGSMIITPTGEGQDKAQIDKGMDRIQRDIEQSVKERRWKKQNLKLANLLGISQTSAAEIGNKIMAPLTEGISRATDNPAMLAKLTRLQNRIQNTMDALSKTKGGAKLIFEVETRGDDKVQHTFRVLAAHKFGRKLLDIVARGGPQARKWLFDISRTKLGQKMVRILAKGGPEARSLLRSLSNAKLRDKILRIIERGGPNVEARLERITGIDLGSKQLSVSEIGAMPTLGKLHNINRTPLNNKSTTISAIDRATSVISSVLGMLGSIPRFIQSTIQVVRKVVGGGRAAGGELREDPMEKALRAAAAPERTRGGLYNQPKFLVGDHEGRGGPAEVVISPDPAVRESNIAYWKRAARMLGIPGFREGYGGASSPEGYSKAMDRLTGPRSQIERKKQAIDNAEKNFEQRERGFTTGFDESTFLNADGSVNNAAIQARAAQIQELIDLKITIQHLWTELIAVIESTINQVRGFIRQINAGLKRMPDMVKRSEGSGKDRKKVWKPNERKKKLSETRDELLNAIPGLTDEKTAATEGFQDVQLDINDLAANKYAVLGTKAETTPAERIQAGLEAALAVAGTTADPGDDKTATDALIEFHRGQLAAAQGMLSDADPTNDYAAHQLISQHAGALKGYIDDSGGGAGGSGGATGILNEMAALSTARSDLYRQYGGNAAPMGDGGAGKVVNVTNNYQTQPVDPHTWTAQLQWELEAVI